MSLMTPLSVFHSFTFVTLFIVVASGLFVLRRCWRRMMLIELGAVVLSIVAAAYWIGISYLLSNIAVCRSDSTLCLYGTAYQLVRNLAFVLFHAAVGRRASRSA